MAVRSDRLKKLEAELEDLKNWLKLGLVPKSDQSKHKKEMGSIELKIEDEKEKIRFLKENNEIEEYVTPKRSAQKPVFNDANVNDFSASCDSDSDDFDGEDDGKSSDDEDEDGDVDHFSDQARARRSWDAVDPESNEW